MAASPSSPPPSPPPPPHAPDDDDAGASPRTSAGSSDRGGDAAATARPRASLAIPPITPVASQADPATLARGLEGRFVDEFGNVLGWDGAVLGRVRGDLPAMVGRPVSARGHVVDADGQVAGFVSENLVPASAPASPPPPTRPLDRSLRVDADGTIYDADGVPVGSMTQARGEPRRPRAPDSSCPRAPAAPSPSEVCLDVKSTHDGIQLIIKIPTVFHACPGHPPPPPPPSSSPPS